VTEGRRGIVLGAVLIGLFGRPFLTTEVGPYALIAAGLAVVALGLVGSRRRAD